MFRSVLWNIDNTLRDTRNRLRFAIHSWQPRGRTPIYLAYYPDSFKSSAALRPIYRRWIRGNRTNNNGDAARFIALMLNLRQVLADNIPGDFAELGVWKGNSAAILADFSAQSHRHLFLFDTFSGFDARDLVATDENHKPSFADTSVGYVQQTVGRTDGVTCVQGFFPDSLTDDIRARSFALAHIDCDLYGPMKAALEFFYPRMPRGGMLILHDYSSGTWQGATQAIDEFCASTGEFLTLWPDKSGTAIIRKSR